MILSDRLTELVPTLETSSKCIGIIDDASLASVAPPSMLTSFHSDYPERNCFNIDVFFRGK